jgi:hypothetical protein
MNRPLFEKDGFIICFEAEPEDRPIKEYFRKDCGWTAKQCRGLEKLAWFNAKVSAWKDGEEKGAAYLGACAYKTEEEFYTVYKDDYFADMVEEAIDEAKKA